MAERIPRRERGRCAYPLAITNTYITGNKAGSSGGGIYEVSTVFSRFENIYSKNKAPDGPDVGP